MAEILLKFFQSYVFVLSVSNPIHTVPIPLNSNANLNSLTVSLTPSKLYMHADFFLLKTDAAKCDQERR